MSSDALFVGSFSASAATVLYQMCERQMVRVALVPVVGYTLLGIGEHFDSEKIKTIGISVIFASAVMIPSSAVGCCIYVMGGKTFVATSVACAVGAGVAYKSFMTFVKGTSEAAARHIAGVR